MPPGINLSVRRQSAFPIWQEVGLAPIAPRSTCFPNIFWKGLYVQKTDQPTDRQTDRVIGKFHFLTKRVASLPKMNYPYDDTKHISIIPFPFQPFHSPLKLRPPPHSPSRLQARKRRKSYEKCIQDFIMGEGKEGMLRKMISMATLMAGIFKTNIKYYFCIVKNMAL